MHTLRTCLRDVAGATRSPAVFLHGFPDSSAMYAAYVAPEERDAPWLAGRSIHVLDFPNRHLNPDFPARRALAGGVLAREFDALLDALVAESPTGRLVLVAHDWGATHAWRWARARGGAGVERMVALSVGSSFRYDVGEHGFNAFTWLYGLWFCLALYAPFLSRLVARTIVSGGGYRSDTWPALGRDAYHYWDRPRLLWEILPQALFGLHRRPEYVDFPFPVLYLRSGFDRIASTRAFERTLASRPDCRILVRRDWNHWFPEQHADEVLPEVRAFLAG